MLPFLFAALAIPTLRQWTNHAVPNIHSHHTKTSNILSCQKISVTNEDYLGVLSWKYCCPLPRSTKHIHRQTSVLPAVNIPNAMKKTPFAMTNNPSSTHGNTSKAQPPSSPVCHSCIYIYCRSKRGHCASWHLASLQSQVAANARQKVNLKM